MFFSLMCFFPEIEEVGFSLDSIPGLRSLLCHFAITPCRSPPRPCRIARARRGDSICAVGPPNGVGWEIQNFAFNTTHQQHRGTAHLLAFCNLDVLALFGGFTQRSKQTFGRSRRDLPLHAVGPPIGVGRKIEYSRRDLAICLGFRGIGHPASS